MENTILLNCGPKNRQGGVVEYVPPNRKSFCIFPSFPRKMNVV